MLGLTHSRKLEYQFDAWVKKQLPEVEEKQEEVLTRVQKMNKMHYEALNDDEKLQEVIKGLIRKDGSLEGLDFKDLIDELLKAKVSEMSEKVADTANMSVLHKILKRGFSYESEIDKAERRLLDNDYSENVVKFVEDLESVDNSIANMQEELTTLYMECKKKKDMIPFYEKVEGLYTKIFEANGFEVCKEYKSKVEKLRKKQEKRAHSKGAGKGTSNIAQVRFDSPKSSGFGAGQPI